MKLCGLNNSIKMRWILTTRTVALSHTVQLGQNWTAEKCGAGDTSLHFGHFGSCLDEPCCFPSSVSSWRSSCNALTKDNCRMVSLWEGERDTLLAYLVSLIILPTKTPWNSNVARRPFLGADLTLRSASKTPKFSLFGTHRRWINHKWALLDVFADPSQGGSGRIPVEQASRSTRFSSVNFFNKWMFFVLW